MQDAEAASAESPVLQQLKAGDWVDIKAGSFQTKPNADVIYLMPLGDNVLRCYEADITWTSPDGKIEHDISNVQANGLVVDTGRRGLEGCITSFCIEELPLGAETSWVEMVPFVVQVEQERHHRGGQAGEVTQRAFDRKTAVSVDLKKVTSP